MCGLLQSEDAADGAKKVYNTRLLILSKFVDGSGDIDELLVHFTDCGSMYVSASLGGFLLGLVSELL